jgi:PAS domain S-box-containing protein
VHHDEEQLVVDGRVRRELLERQELRELQVPRVGQEVDVGLARPAEASLLPVAHRSRAYGRIATAGYPFDTGSHILSGLAKGTALDDIERTEERDGRSDPETLPSVDADDASELLIPGAEEILALVTVGAADGITIQDAQGRLVYANLAAGRLSGYESVEAFLGAEPTERLAHWEILTEDGDPFPVEHLPGRRVLVGEMEAEAMIRVRDRRDEREFWSLVKATATFDARGGVRYAINVFREITGQKEVELAAQRQATQMSHLYAATPRP